MIGTYTIGPPTRPNITHDRGFLDQFAPRDPTIGDRASYAAWGAVLEGAEAAQGVPGVPHNNIPDALAAYRHFRDGNGTTRTIAYDRYLANDASGRTTLRNIVREVKEAAIRLHRHRFLNTDGEFRFTGSALSAGAGNRLFPYPATENWQKAIGAYHFWLSGTARVLATGRREAAFEFDVDFTIHVEDMYNFNPSAQDITTGIPDSANGVFEVTGLAQGYLNTAEVTRSVHWTGIEVDGPQTVNNGPSRRLRQPSDNRRLRNRV